METPATRVAGKAKDESLPEAVELRENASPAHSEKEVGNLEKGDPGAAGGLRRAFSIDPGVEKRLIRKLDWNLVPLVSVLYLLAFIDRSNIGNANTAGMKTDLNYSTQQYQWLLNIFYIPYIIFEFGVIGWKLVPPHIWASIMVLGWGIAAVAQTGVHGWSGLMACRFFLGAFEASYGPGVPYLLSFFYLRHELGLRAGLFLSAAPLASCFAGALAYGIVHAHGDAIANWRLLFLVEALPTIAMVPFVFFFLPDGPEKARFLTTEEQEMARSRTTRQIGTDAHSKEKLKLADIFAALRDPKIYFTAFMYFSCNVGFSSLPVFLPEILEDMGFTAINAQGLTAPPYFISFMFTWSSCWVADRTQQRGLVIMVFSCIGGIGYVLLATVDSVGVRYFGVFLAAAGIFPSIANILSWTLNNQGSDTRRSVGIAVLNLVGQCGPLLGTNVYTDAPRYIKGFSVCAAFTFFTAILAFSLRTLLVWENKKLDEKYGPRVKKELRRTTIDEAYDPDAAGEENYGKNFRYVL